MQLCAGLLSCEAVRGSVPGVSPGLVTSAPLPSTPHIPDAQGKQVLSTNHIICINSLGEVSHSYQGMLGTPMTSQFLDCRQGQLCK